MKFLKIPVSKITPAPYNPRLDLKPGDPEYEKIKRSIEEFGFVEPLVWNEFNGVLVGGHQRLKVLIQLGHTEVDVSVVHITDENKEKALNVALNKVTGEFDFPKLQELLKGLKAENYDVSLTGFEQHDLDNLLAGEWCAPKLNDLAPGTHPDEMELFKTTKEQADVIRQAIARVKEKCDGVETLSEGRALELISADYLGGP